MNNPLLKCILASVIIVLATASLGGCETPAFLGGVDNDPGLAKQTLLDRVETLEAQKETVLSSVGTIESTIQRFQSQLDAVPDDDSIADKLRDGIDTLKVELAKVKDAEDDIDQAIASTKAQVEAIIDDPVAGATGTTVGLDGIAAGARSAGAVIPGPIGDGLAIVGMSLAGIAEFLRRRQKRRDEIELHYTQERSQEAIDQAESQIETIVFGLDNAQKADPELKKSIQKNGPVIRASYGRTLNAKIKGIRAVSA